MLFQKIFRKPLFAALGAIFGEVPEAVIFIDEAGKIAYANAAVWKMFGIPQDQLSAFMNAPWERLFTEKGQQNIRNNVMPEVNEKGFWRGESKILRHDGKIAYNEMSLKRLKNGAMIGIARDITARVVLEEKRQRLEQQIYRTQKLEALARISNGFAHDFNNVLSTIAGFSEFLVEDIPADQPLHTYARNIRAAAQEGKYMVEKIRLFSKHKKDHSEKLYLADVLRETLWIARASSLKDVEIDLQLSDAPLQALMNREHISQMLLNLLENAREASLLKNRKIIVRFTEAKDDPVLEQLRNEAATYGDDTGDQSPHFMWEGENGSTRLLSGLPRINQTYSCIEVIDEGVGMNRVILEHAVEPFFTTHANEKHSGLGLAYVQGIVNSHNGMLVIDSAEGVGTHVRVYLPLLSPEEMESSPRYEDPVAVAQKSCFVIDDDHRVRGMVNVMLARMGVEAIPFSSAEFALRTLATTPHQPDMILCDYLLGDMSGVAFAHALKAQGYAIPLILMTASSEALELDPLYDPAVFVDMLKKPLQKTAVKRALSAALESREERKAKEGT
ncbi:MAG: ATP-binding protein [Pseudobdellovibrionaceae bacterium]